MCSIWGSQMKKGTKNRPGIARVRGKGRSWCALFRKDQIGSPGWLSWWSTHSSSQFLISGSSGQAPCWAPYWMWGLLKKKKIRERANRWVWVGQEETTPEVRTLEAVRSLVRQATKGNSECLNKGIGLGWGIMGKPTSFSMCTSGAHDSVS